MRNISHQLYWRQCNPQHWVGEGTQGSCMTSILNALIRWKYLVSYCWPTKARTCTIGSPFRRLTPFFLIRSFYDQFLAKLDSEKWVYSRGILVEKRNTCFHKKKWLIKFGTFLVLDRVAKPSVIGTINRQTHQNGLVKFSSLTIRHLTHRTWRRLWLSVVRASRVP